MENSISAVTAASSLSYPTTALQSQYAQDALVLETSLGSPSGESDDASVIDINRLTQGISATADQILAKLNELLADKVPNGIENLNPDDYTPEKTAATVVDSITSLFAAYKKSNPELSPDEALNRFLAAARSGVEQGYSDAANTLDSIGAFQFDGVQSGIEETKKLISTKLDAFEEAQRKLIQQESGVTDAASGATTAALQTQAGIRIAA